MAPLRPTVKLRAALSTDSPLSSLPPSVREASNASTPLSSPPPSPSAGQGAAQASSSGLIAVSNPPRKRRAVLSSSDDEGDVSSLVILESSPVKRSAPAPNKAGGSILEPKVAEPSFPSASAESAPDSDLLVMGSSQATSSHVTAKRSAGTSQTSAAVKKAKAAVGIDYVRLPLSRAYQAQLRVHPY
jgi:hypothetical protein